MEMTYGGALVMPSSYAVMDEEEMTYLEGGGTFTLGIKFKQNSFVINFLSSIAGALTTTKVAAALATITGLIITAIELGTAGLATLYLGAVILAFGNIIPVIAGAAVTSGILSLHGRTFKKSISGEKIPTLTLCPTI